MRLFVTMATKIYSSFKDIVQYYLLNLRASWNSQILPLN